MKKIKCDCYWNKKRTKWKQPPAPILIGDLVTLDISKVYNTREQVLGRYIGNGLGLAYIYDYTKSREKSFYIGHVVSRGLDNNPPLPTINEVLDYTKYLEK